MHTMPRKKIMMEQAMLEDVVHKGPFFSSDFFCWWSKAPFCIRFSVLENICAEAGMGRKSLYKSLLETSSDFTRSEEAHKRLSRILDFQRVSLLLKNKSRPV